MKHDDFIQDLEALCRQYWGKEFDIGYIPKIDDPAGENTIVIIFDKDIKETK